MFFIAASTSADSVPTVAATISAESCRRSATAQENLPHFGDTCHETAGTDVARMKFYYFHLMPYVMEHDEPSSWVTLSNRFYDPKVGQTLYHQYLDQLEYAEALGWDGLCVNEHHQNCYGTMPSPNVMAAMLLRRTSRANIAILGLGRWAAPRRATAKASRGPPGPAAGT